MAPAVATYEPRDPSRTVLSKVVAEHLETLLASLNAEPDAKGLPASVEREFYDYGFPIVIAKFYTLGRAPLRCGSEVTPAGWSLALLQGI